MPGMKPIVALLIVLGFPIAFADAQQPRDRENAAYWYERAFEAFEHISPHETVVIADYLANPDQKPTREIREILDSATRAMSYMRRGSERAYADFGLDYGQGINLLLPHLSQQRQVMRMLHADALLAIHDGHSMQAADRLATAYRVSAHSADDTILISALVGAAIFSDADKIVQFSIDRGALNRDDAATLLREVQNLPSDDPFGIVDAAAMEQTMMVNWLTDRFSDSGGEALGKQFAQAIGDEMVVEQFESMTEDDFVTAVDQYDHAMNLAVEALSESDPAVARAKLDALKQKVVSGELGPLARIMLPSYDRVYERLEHSRTLLRNRIASLRELAEGQVAPDELANAAVWYRRAIEALAKVDEEYVKAIRNAAGRPTGSLSEQTRQALKEVQSIVSVIRKGSHKRHCDFSAVYTDAYETVIPPYAAGMRDVLRVLLVHAIADLHDNDTNVSDTQDAKATEPSNETASRRADVHQYDDVVTHLATSFRVIAHLNDDPRIFSARVAHNGFNEAMSIVSEAVSHERLNGRQRLTLLNAARKISHSDPFGYIVATVMLRDDLASQLNALIKTLHNSSKDNDAPAPDQPIREDKAYQSADADQMVYMRLVLEAIEQGVEAMNERYEPSLVGLRGMIDARALHATLDEAAMIEIMLSKNQFDLFHRDDVPIIADLETHMTNARTDLRQAIALIQPDQPLRRSGSTRRGARSPSR